MKERPERNFLLQTWLENASLEVLPGRRAFEIVLSMVPKRKIDVVSSPTLPIESTIDLSVSLAKKGVNVVPHIAARSLADVGHLIRTFDKLKKAGIGEVFVIGGDNENQKGYFTSAVNLLDAIHLIGINLKKVAVAGYPEGHLKIPDSVLMDVLKEKQEWSKSSGTDVRIVSQVCFSAKNVLAWVEKIRENGITLPVDVGIISPVKLSTLITFVRSYGIENSTRFIRERISEAVKTGKLPIERYDPAKFLADLSGGVEGKHNITGIHFFTFNALPATSKWIKNQLHPNLAHL